MRQVLQRLYDNKLYVKAEKCEFHSASVAFLGYILESGQVKTDLAKVQTVVDWETPTTRKQLQRFLGFANFYRRFVPNYSQVASPLTRLTSLSLCLLYGHQMLKLPFRNLRSGFPQHPS